MGPNMDLNMGIEQGGKTAVKQSPAGEQKTVTIIDGSSGARHDVVIGDGTPTRRKPTPRPR